MSGFTRYLIGILSATAIFALAGYGLSPVQAGAPGPAGQAPTLQSQMTLAPTAATTQPGEESGPGEGQPGPTQGASQAATAQPTASLSVATQQTTSAPAPTATLRPGQVYTVQSGETLSQIASRFGISLQALVQANPNLLPGGSTLIIPTTQSSVPQTGRLQSGQTAGGVQLRHPYANPDNLGPYAIYVVRSGDTLGGIAKRFHTTIGDLLAMNPHVRDQNVIYSGQWILVHPDEQVIVNPPGWEQTGATLTPTP